MVKASTIGTFALVGIGGIAAYYLISSVKNAIDNFKLPEFPNIPAAINNWTASFAETPAQTAARLATQPSQIVSNLRESQGLISSVNPPQINLVTSPVPAVANILNNPAQGYVKYTPDNQVSLGSSATFSTIRTSSPVSLPNPTPTPVTLSLFSSHPPSPQAVVASGLGLNVNQINPAVNIPTSQVTTAAQGSSLVSQGFKFNVQTQSWVK